MEASVDTKTNSNLNILLTFVKCVNRKTCWNRHPKQCKYCKIDESCKYLHNQGEKVNADISDKIIKEKDDDTMEMDVGLITYSRVNKMEKVIASKENAIKELTETKDTLNKDIKGLTAQIEMLKRVATNIHNELKNLQSRKA